MKKCVYTLNIGNYEPEITRLTYPFIKLWCRKIDADFFVIDQRKYPSWPMDYEKLQIYDLGKNYDWNIYIDSDAIVHPDFFDVTEHVKKDCVVHYGTDMANIRFRYDNYFRRDGRNVGSCNWFAIASDWCLDLWHPLCVHDITMEEALNNITPTNLEITSKGPVGMKPGHLISDYTLSRNIAKYGLKVTTVQKILQGLDPTNSLGGGMFHDYLVSGEEKLEQIKVVLKKWRLN